MNPGLRALYHGSAIYHLLLTGRSPRELALKLDPWPGDAVQGEALLAGEFRFESEAVRAPSPPWRAGTSEEWRADLQRFKRDTQSSKIAAVAVAGSSSVAPAAKPSRLPVFAGAAAAVVIAAVLAVGYFAGWFAAAHPYSQAELKPQQLTANSIEDP